MKKEIEEIWVETEVKGRPYLVSTLGKIKRPAQTIAYESSRGTIARPYSEKVCRCTVGSAGYLRLGFSVGSKKHTVSAHSIIARAFLGERPAGMVINHKNGIKTDNRLENLEYCTQSRNVQHAFDKDLNKAKGIDHHSSVLNNEQLAFIRENLGKMPQRKIAEIVGVGEHIVSNIKVGLTYSTEKKIEITESEFDQAFIDAGFGFAPETRNKIKEKLFNKDGVI